MMTEITEELQETFKGAVKGVEGFYVIEKKRLSDNSASYPSTFDCKGNFELRTRCKL